MPSVSAGDARRLYEELAVHSDTVGAYSFISKEDQRRYHFGERQTRVAADCEVVETLATAHEARRRGLLRCEYDRRSVALPVKAA